MVYTHSNAFQNPSLSGLGTGALLSQSLVSRTAAPSFHQDHLQKQMLQNTEQNNN